MVGMRALAGAFFCALTTAAIAQDYPSKPITLIVPFPEKVGGDLLARPFAEKLTAALGQPINVQNVPGKSGSAGVGQGTKASPDGYTLIFSGDAALTTNLIIFETIGYDPRQDLAPIALLIATQNAIIVSANSAARSLDELVKASRDKAGQNYAHAGTGFSSHVAGEIIKKHAQLDLKATAHTSPPEFFKAVEDETVLFGITGVARPFPE
jgi:tripartite-type tricarboxylate transporter receptor subunit TctC